MERTVQSQKGAQVVDILVGPDQLLDDIVNLAVVDGQLHGDHLANAAAAAVAIIALAQRRWREESRHEEEQEDAFCCVGRRDQSLAIYPISNTRFQICHHSPQAIRGLLLYCKELSDK